MKLLLCNSLGLVLQLLLVSVAQLQSFFGLLLFQVSQRCKGVLNQRLATLATHGGKLGTAAASLAGYQPINVKWARLCSILVLEDSYLQVCPSLSCAAAVVVTSERAQLCMMSRWMMQGTKRASQSAANAAGRVRKAWVKAAGCRWCFAANARTADWDMQSVLAQPSLCYRVIKQGI